MSEIDFIRAERDSLQTRLNEQTDLSRKLIMRPLFCRGVDSLIREYDGELIREQQGCEVTDPHSRVLLIKRQVVREILERLTCRSEIVSCLGMQDIEEWMAKYFPSDSTAQTNEPG